MNRSKFVAVVFCLLFFGSFVHYVPAACGQEKKYFFQLAATASIATPSDLSVVEVMKKELEKIGIELKPDYVEYAKWRDKALRNVEGKTFDQGGSDIVIGQPGVGPAWVYNARYWFASGNTYNFWDSAKFDNLLLQAETEVNFDKYVSITRGMQKVLYDEQVWATVYNAPYPYVMKKEVDAPELPNYSRLFGTTRIQGKNAADDTTLIFATSVTPEGLLWSVRSSPFYETNDPLFIDRQAGGFVPHLLESYEIKDDGLTWIFHLPKNVTWHDGVPFTAKDVVFTLNVNLDPGAEAYEVNLAKYFKSVESTDDYTVLVRLKSVVTPDLIKRSLSRPSTYPVPMHVMRDVPVKEWVRSKFNVEAPPPGVGPYKFVKYVKDEYMEFVANDKYRKGRPFVDRIIVRTISDRATALVALEKGEVDILDGWRYGYTKELKDAQANPKLKVLLRPSDQIGSLEFNLKHPILANKYVRWAISYAIPRQQIVNDLIYGFGTPVSVPVAVHYPEYDKTIPLIEYSIDKAKQMMVKAGYNYAWLEPPPPIPVTVYILPAIGGLAAGAIATAAAFLMKKKK